LREQFFKQASEIVDSVAKNLLENPHSHGPKSSETEASDIEVLDSNGSAEDAPKLPNSYVLFLRFLFHRQKKELGLTLLLSFVVVIIAVVRMGRFRQKSLASQRLVCLCCW
jgi:hypothetical protein